MSFLCLLVCLWRALAAEQPAPVHLSTTLVVQVPDVAVARDALIAAAEQEGGWFSALSNDAVSLRVPLASADALESFARGLGRVVSRAFQQDDLSASLRDEQNALAARERTLSRYFEVLESANATSVVSVEREITRLVQEIEGYRGRIRLLEHRGSVAEVNVSFQFRDRRRPVGSGTSSFAWINEVTLGDLLDSFREGRTGRRVPGLGAEPPEGFAAWPAKRGIRALSADDVVWRARSFKTRPKATLSYWSEALTRTLTEAGYTLTGEGAQGAGARSEWTAPDGERDAAWILCLYVDGGRVVVVEAAGEAARVAARRDLILSSLGSVRP